MQDYEKLAKIGIEKYNDDGFCAVVALATVTGLSFKRVKRKLEKLGRVHRKGTETSTMIEFLKRYNVDYKWLNFTNRPTIGELVRQSSKGTFLLFTNGHVSAMVDSDLNDHTNPNRNKRRKQYSKAHVYRVLQITKEEI